MTSVTRTCRLVDELAAAGKVSLPILLDAIRDSDAEVRGAAARALGRIEDRCSEVVDALTASLDDEALIVRQSATAALGVLGPLPVRTVSALQRALNDEDRHVREFAALALDSAADYRMQIAWAC